MAPCLVNPDGATTVLNPFRFLFPSLFAIYIHVASGSWNNLSNSKHALTLYIQTSLTRFSDLY